jgi:excisionase family DNA binding protein
MSRRSERRWLTPAEAAAILGVSKRTLTRWRAQGLQAPAWRRLSHRIVRYDARTIDA